MPLAIPAVVGAIAGAGSLAFGFTTTIVGSAIVGAVAGAAVNGIKAAIEGGNIAEGVLFGAVGGAVGGAIGGFAIDKLGFAGTWGKESAAFGADGFSKLPGGVPPSLPKGGGALSLGMGDAAQAALVTGGLGATQAMMTPEPEMPYSQTKEGFEAELEAKKELAALQASQGSGTVAAARIAAEQRQREAELNAQLTREQMSQSGSEFHKSLAQRRAELERPIEEANLARQRRIETATGLTLARKKREEEAIS